MPWFALDDNRACPGASRVIGKPEILLVFQRLT
jgi:hypothetical protein